ncbi:MAG: glycoside hydrolase family 13 protein [Clostridia bacterium]|nr:glycoside hydrolase family 13 protein [Clostridia bacterium]
MIKSFEELKFDIRPNRDVSLFGAFPLGGTLRFEVRISKNIEPQKVDMVIHEDGWGRDEKVYGRLEFAMSDTSDDYISFSREMELSSILQGKRGLYYYHYAVFTPDGTVYYGGERPTALVELKDFVGERQLLLYDDGYNTSQSFKRGVVYQIFVDRFKRSGKCKVKAGSILNGDWDNGIPQYAEYPGAPLPNNMFFGGDLYGVADELEYISSLGVETIYLCPIFDAYSNHKYDTGDYLKVDSMFSGDDALIELCDKAKAYGIDVILDGVFNHTGSNSVYFNKDGKYDSLGAYQSKESPYYSWYGFSNYPNKYDCWWGIDILPRVDSSNSDYRRFICESVVDKWMKAGVAGWRLDVADEIASEFLDDFRCAVKKRNPDGVIIGEVWEDATDKISYGKRREYLLGGQLDSVMNYPLRAAVISYVMNGDSEGLRYSTESLYRRYPKCASDNLLNFLGTHDTERILTVFSGIPAGNRSNRELSSAKMNDKQRRVAVDRLKFAYGLIAGLPGVPCVFYGDEAGLEGYRDPFCRRTFPWANMNRELLRHYRIIGAIRKEHDVFRDGLFRIISLTPEHFVYVREPYIDGEEKIIVAASRTGKLSLQFPTAVRQLYGAEEYISECTIDEKDVGYYACPANMDLSKIIK